ncbi:UTP--glucose-1-phosphate uridylyltransferase GalU [Salsuginibacillus kocurii]|uniref:UTP--glucose-1-phosphate uridylyltransferase GalU n=1 Tax=Salsuginibacillus kocurii TaxID=427078 RepID=UPI0003630A93|nr:UTP--glucose-1-phosphate uridylyltransferase GalU [Salsuginibacillus kocurii]
MKVRKAIIPAAGLGTRFLPATKAQPKEMLPIVDKPTIQYIVEEAIESGIEDIMIVTGRGKRAIEDHFDKSYELEETLLKKSKVDLFTEVQGISQLANIHYIRQKEPKGLGHAIACAHSFIGNEPFAVMLGDDIVRTNGKPCLRQLIESFEEHEASVVGVQEVPAEDVSKYGIISPLIQRRGADVIEVADLIEKPEPAEAPSRHAIMGRYVLTPEVLEILETQEPGAGNEIQLTDALRTLNQFQSVKAYPFSGERYDVGDKLGFVKATVDFALAREDLRDDMAAYLEQLKAYENV